MNKLRMIFLSCSILIAVAAFFWLNRPDFSLTGPEKNISSTIVGFQITGISENGNVYFANDETKSADIKTMQFAEETRLRSDDQTAWEFYFDGVLFTALPGSGIHYTPQTREMILKSGEFYWEKKLAHEKVEISLLKPGNIFRLSASGRIRLGSNSLEVWNYAGQMDFDYNNRFYQLQAAQYINVRSGEKSPPADLLAPPPFISPEAETISLTKPNDSVIQFKWKNVQGARNYVLKIYPSPLRENILLNKVIAGNAVMLDILPYSEYSELYWEVAAFDADKNIESAPAKMGVIKISSSLLKKGLTPQSPIIEVSSLSVSGNMVLIKGSTDPTVQLSIDGVIVKLDNDGKFIHTITFKSIGVKEIVFRAVAPSGLEVLLKKQVTIFEE